MKSTLLVVFSLLVLLPGVVWPQDKCPEKFSKFGEEWCGAEKARLAFEEADADLNKAYQKMLKAMSAERKKRVVNAQRKWLTSSRADCSVSAGMDSPGANSVKQEFYANCLAEKTLAKTRDFEILLQK